MKSKNKIHIRIKQAIITFLMLFFIISFFTKTIGEVSGEVKNPYYSSKREAITWKEFYLTIPKNLLVSLIGTIFICAPYWYEDYKKHQANKEIDTKDEIKK